ncbi:DNA primase, partial [Escherichia coli]|nr:DNA primase [Escherichia coli]
QPKDKMTEVIIFAGSDAWSYAKEWKEWAGKHIAADDTPPIVLGPEQLVHLADTQIIDKGRYYVRVYRAGEISEQHLTQIATLLAVAGVKEARCYSSFVDQQPEDWTPRLAGLKDDAERGKSLVINLPAKTNFTGNHDDELKPRVECRPDGIYWVTPKV